MREEIRKTKQLMRLFRILPFNISGYLGFRYPGWSICYCGNSFSNAF